MTSDNGNNGSAALLLRYASFLGATGVSAGAFGAHALKDRLTNKGHENWKTAVVYQLLHATVLVGMSACNQSATSKNARNGTVLAGKLMTVGTVLFSGSIYLLSLNIGPKKLLGPTTPIGGLCMIAGWIVLGINAASNKSSEVYLLKMMLEWEVSILIFICVCRYNKEEED